MIPYRAKMVRFKTAMMRFKVCENDSFSRPPPMFYKYRRKNIMTKYIQAYVSSSVKQPFTNCFFPMVYRFVTLCMGTFSVHYP